MRKFAVQGMIVLLAGISTAFCGNDPLPAPDFLLWGRYTLGQVKSSATEIGSFEFPFQNEWLENIDGGVRATRRVNSHLIGRLNIAFSVNASSVKQAKTSNVEITARKFTAALLDASLQYTRDKLFMESGLFQIEFGYFPFKYNPQSTNLGEYLFRSNTYPGVIVSGFEHSIDKPKVGGIHFSYTGDFFGTFRQDLLLTSELDIYPLRDLNLTCIATYTLHPVFTFGAGIEGQRLIVLDSVKTTPGLDTTAFKPGEEKWVGYIDPVTGDTTRYTFRGTKIMARATLDIKELIEFGTGKLGFFGTEDLKLYGEAAILGVKNYPGWYNKLSERIPAMVGINLPAFKLLDVFSVEVERYTTPYWNSQEIIWKAHSPVPYVDVGTTAGMNYTDWNDSLAKTDDDIKWSVYASKKIGSILRISAQVASDHTPRNWYNPGPPPSLIKYTDVVPRTKDWYYMMRVSFYF